MFNISTTEGIKKYRQVAEDSVQAELSQMVAKDVWEPVNYRQVPRGSVVIPAFVFLKEKYDAAGNFLKVKSRLVAGDHMQGAIAGEDESSPTASLTYYDGCRYRRPRKSSRPNSGYRWRIPERAHEEHEHLHDVGQENNWRDENDRPNVQWLHHEQGDDHCSLEESPVRLQKVRAAMVRDTGAFSRRTFDVIRLT